MAALLALTWSACAAGVDREPRWRLADRAGSLDLFAVDLAGGSAWAAGDIDPRGLGGHFHRSADWGRTWSAIAAKTEVLTGLHFLDGRTGWLAGYAGRIERTDDGGATWRVQRTERPSEVLNAICAIDTEQVWAVGARGAILRTTDGGAEWSTVDGGRREDLWAVRFASATRGWIAGGRGLLLETSDGGNSWRPIASGTTSALYGLAVRPPASVVAVGERGTILSSPDGAAWSVTRVEMDGNLNGVDVSGTTFWAVGDRGAIARSDDEGRTWSITPAVTGVKLSAVALAGARGIAAGQRGTILVLD